MQFAKLFTQDEVKDLIAQAVNRIGNDSDDVKFGMAAALIGARIASEIDDIIDEMKKETKNGTKEA